MRVIAGATRALEWGTQTDQPGSLVRDRDGKMIFTDSRVVLPATGVRGRNPRVAHVVALLDRETVRVEYLSAGRRTGEFEALDAREVLVREAVPQT